MNSSAKDAARREREREHAALLAAAASEVAALASLVRAREDRAPAGLALEIAFASARDDARADQPTLPAGVWVALRRGDVDAALEALIAVSGERFVLGAREELGEGYRLRTVEDVRVLPDVGALRSQLASMLDIPTDVLAILSGWGPDDPRTSGEIDLLLDSRFGPAGSSGDASTQDDLRARAAHASDAERTSLFVQPVPDEGSAALQAPSEPRPPLTMYVAELADVLQLSAAQARVLATVVRHTRLAVTDEEM